MNRVLTVALVVVAAIVLVATPASGHSGDESYIYLEIFDDAVEGRVEIPVADLGEVLGLDIPQGSGAAASIESNLDEIHRYVSTHFALGPSGEWPIEYEGYEILDIGVGTFVVLPFSVDRQFDSVPRRFETSYSVVIESNPDRRALLLIATDFGSGTFDNESEHLLVYSSGDSTKTVDLDEASLLSGVWAVVGLGIEHIEIGFDHILFILALVLPAVLHYVPGSGWKPAPQFKSSFWRVAKIATSFTIAHTVTLTLGGLGVIELSPNLVEPIIAVSIALAALHNIKPVLVNREWLVAFGFGLFHGFGFAGLLAELGLDRSNRLISLLGFNLGIEVGQIAIIAMVFPALYLLRRTRVYLPLMRVGSWILFVIAMVWFVDRVFSIDLGVDRLVGPVLEWPRSFVLVVAGTLIASGWYRFEAGRQRLISVGDLGDSSDVPQRVTA